MKLLKKLRALYGQDWINNVKSEFKIQDFDGFINDVTVKLNKLLDILLVTEDIHLVKLIMVNH